MIEVVAAVIRRGGRYLIGRRPSHKHHGGLWEFPGGKLLDGESLETAIRRELLEELALDDLQVGEVLRSIETESIRIHFLTVTCADEPECIEHSALRWCTVAQLTALPLCPTDERFVRSL